MAIVIGEVSVQNKKQVMIVEALQNALEKVPPFPGTDVVHFHVTSIDVEFGGIAYATKTRVTVEVEPGPLKDLGTK